MVSTALKAFGVILIFAVLGLGAGILGLSDDVVWVLAVAGVTVIFISGLMGRGQSDQFTDLIG